MYPVQYSSVRTGYTRVGMIMGEGKPARYSRTIAASFNQSRMMKNISSQSHTISYSLLLVCLGLLLCSHQTKAQQVASTTPKQPNILFIMSDDHPTQAFGCYRTYLSELNPTPVIDSLAAEGMVMENAFCVNSICSPSRACILSGQHSNVNGVQELRQPLPAGRQYLPLVMRSLGYQTAIIGKWHLTVGPEAFDHYQVMRDQGDYQNPMVCLQHTPQAISTTGRFHCLQPWPATQCRAHRGAQFGCDHGSVPGLAGRP